MPPRKTYTEQNDNTRVVLPRVVMPPLKPQKGVRKPTPTPQNKAYIVDANKAEARRRKQNLTNYSALGNGIQGTQMELNPANPENWPIIDARYSNYANNTMDFLGNIATGALFERAGAGLRYLSTVGKASGAESVVTIRPFNVVKESTITLPEAQGLNKVPIFQRLTPKGKSGTMNVYQQKRLTPIPVEQEAKAVAEVTPTMEKNGWFPFTHPNLSGTAFTNRKFVFSDIQYGRDILGRIKAFDGIIQLKPDFVQSMLKKGGKFYNKN